MRQVGGGLRSLQRHRIGVKARSRAVKSLPRPAPGKTLVKWKDNGDLTGPPSRQARLAQTGSASPALKSAVSPFFPLADFTRSGRLPPRSDWYVYCSIFFRLRMR
jgi:hypothetical protein